MAKHSNVPYVSKSYDHANRKKGQRTDRVDASDDYFAQLYAPITREQSPVYAEIQEILADFSQKKTAQQQRANEEALAWAQHRTPKAIPTADVLWATYEARNTQENAAWAQRRAARANAVQRTTEVAWQLYKTPEAQEPQQPEMIIPDTSFSLRADKLYAIEKRNSDARKAGKAQETYFGFKEEQLAPLRASIRTYIMVLAEQPNAQLSKRLQLTVERMNYRTRLRAERNVTAAQQPRAVTASKPKRDLTPIYTKIASSEDFKQASLEEMLDSEEIEVSGEDLIGVMMPTAAQGIDSKYFVRKVQDGRISALNGLLTVKPEGQFWEDQIEQANR